MFRIDRWWQRLPLCPPPFRSRLLALCPRPLPGQVRQVGGRHIRPRTGSGRVVCLSIRYGVIGNLEWLRSGP
jgi:hypothetical protein